MGLRELVTAGGGQGPHREASPPLHSRLLLCLGPRPPPPAGPGGFCHSARALSIARETALCHGPAAPLRRPPGLVSGSASQRPLLPADLGQDKKAGSEGWGAALQQSNASLYCGTSRGRFRNVPEAWAAGRPPPVSGGTVAWPRGASVSPSVGTRTAALRAVVGSAAHAGEGGGVWPVPGPHRAPAPPRVRTGGGWRPGSGARRAWLRPPRGRRLALRGGKLRGSLRVAVGEARQLAQLLLPRLCRGDHGTRLARPG